MDKGNHINNYHLSGLISAPRSVTNSQSEFKEINAYLGGEGAQTGEKTIERRACKRKQAKKWAFALLRTHVMNMNQIEKMSMGEVALSVFKSDAVKIGQIKDASIGGLSFNYFGDNGKSKAPLELDILVADKNFYLNNISFKIISDAKVPGQISFEVFKMRQMSIQFQEKNMDKMLKIDQFIKRHTFSTMDLI